METLLKTRNIKQNHSHKEGKVAKAIENQTAKMPSDWFLWTALSCLAVSAGLLIAGRGHASLFAGQLASPLLIMGLYDKVVKVEGHD
jgi:hypothetical protein